MSQYLNTLTLTKGFFLALLGSLFIYLHFYGFSLRLIESILGMLSLYLLLPSSSRVWFWYGFFMGLLWFWWIGLSFIHYQMLWVIPFVLFAIGVLYGGLFWLIATLSEKISRYKNSSFSYTISLLVKALGLLSLSYIHPFGFNWMKPELMFVSSYFGITKWHFGLLLGVMVLSLTKKMPSILLLTLLALQLPSTPHQSSHPEIALITTHIPVEKKWDTSLQPQHFQALLHSIDQAIEEKKTLVILPESVFATFLNHSQPLIDALKSRAKKITIVTGGLYWDGTTPRNSTYIFTKDGKVTIANKVVLVPFGEANPLPDFLSHWVNKIFYDNAIDYKADAHVSDYTVDGTTYRNAICFEATSETLYKNHPKNMIVLSNNGWFTPSIEPTLQKLLLLYYHRKYGTTIYHAINMSESYVIL
jgi:apolipoprotein N-acyltransferase